MSYLAALTHRIRGQELPRDVLVAELAEAQHGVVAAWQLYLLGLSARAVEGRLASGRLHRVHRGVYAVGHTKLSERGYWMAAVLACRKDALLSHRSNAGLRSLMPDGRAVIDVTLCGRGRHSRGKLRVHCRREPLHPDDIEVYDGIPCTSVPLLLLDIAETAPFRHLERIFEAAERERQLDLSKLHELMERSPGRKGLKPLNALLAQFTEPPPRLRSELERRFLEMCTTAGIERPETNASVDEFEVDMLWRRDRVAVELDSWEFHRTRRAFERDRIKLVELQLRGFDVLPFTWRRMQTEPHTLVAAVERSLHAARASVRQR